MRLGVEVEFTGLSKSDVAVILSDYFDSDIEADVITVDCDKRVVYRVEDYSGNVWQ